MGCLTAVATSEVEKMANPRFVANSKIKQVQRQLKHKKSFRDVGNAFKSG